MSTRFNEEELTEDQLQKRVEHFAKGLSILWNEPKKTVLELRESLVTNTQIKRYILPRKERARTGKSSTLKTLLDICIEEAKRDVEGTFSPPTFIEAHNTRVSNTIQKSQLQQRLLDKPIFTDAMQRYFRAISILEYEHDNGLLTDQPFEVTMVGNSVWTPNEKKRFFIALERCGKGNLEQMSERIGPTKTIAEIHDFIHFLDIASKALPPRKKIQHPFAREMSVNFLLQEEHIAQQIQQALEVESYEKHLELCTTHPEVQKANEFFELWNMSSITRLLAGQNDLTILCSTTFNYYQLLKRFIQDIVMDLHTQLLSDTEKIVSKDLVNRVIARKRKFNDGRFEELDVMTVTGGKNKQGNPRWTTRYSTNRSISFLAKRRRLLGEIDGREDASTLMIDEDKADQDVYIMDEEDKEEYEKDPMLEDIDSEDELTGQYVVEDFDAEHEEAVQEYMNDTITDEVLDFNNDIPEELNKEEEEEDAQDEEEMKELDALDEEQLSEYLGFYNIQEIADAQLQKT